MKKSIIKAYAKLIARAGIAVKKGQAVVISAEAENEKFAAMVAEECYKAGAKRVIVDLNSDELNKINYKYASVDELGTMTPMAKAKQEYLTDELAATIFIDSFDPDGMKGMDVKKMVAVRKKLIPQILPYRQKRENKYQWCIAAAPSVAWAKKLFPELSKKQAVEKLWEAILECSRALDGNGLENWKAHDEDLKRRCEYLNSLKLRSLHYTSSNGTDLTVGLIPGVIFLGGGESTLGSNVFYQPNIPSEECFTSPMKGQAEGIVYSSKPLSYNGQVIENFSVRFHEGKAVEVHAEKGEEALASILTIDEGSAYLGECAFVPYDSPINNTGILFYNTLFDENAACHLALGMGFTNLYPEYEKYTEDEIHGFGINDSASHVDFMIGTKDLSVVGIDDQGREIQIFKDGNWAF